MTQLEKEIEHINLKEVFCKKDIGGACLFYMDEDGVLQYDLENIEMYNAAKTVLDQEQLNR